VQKLFGVSNIGMYRGQDPFPEHPSGEAADVMVGLGNKSLGDQVKNYALANAAAYGVLYCLWQQRQWNPDGTSSAMPDRGSPTQNHMDHVHIRTAGGGYPKGGEPAGHPSPAGTSSTPAPAAMAGGAFPMGGVSGAASLAGVGGVSGITGAATSAGQAGEAAGNQMLQQLGGALIPGISQELGFGSVFGKDPTQWGIFKMGITAAKFGMGLAKAIGGAAQAGGGGLTPAGRSMAGALGYDLSGMPGAMTGARPGEAGGGAGGGGAFGGLIVNNDFSHSIGQTDNNVMKGINAGMAGMSSATMPIGGAPAAGLA
jgi:hypothetical protein